MQKTDTFKLKSNCIECQKYESDATNASSRHKNTAQNYKCIGYMHLLFFQENTMCLLLWIYVSFKDHRVLVYKWITGLVFKV